MKIEVYVVTWNEEKNLEQYLNWYSWATDVVVLDNYSDDKTCEIAERLGCKVEKWDSSGVLNTTIKNKVTEECWLDSKADWVIVADVDELIYYPKIEEMLFTNKSIIKCSGYQMISEECKPFAEIKTGTRDKQYDKCVMFRPKEIDRMNWTIGLHSCKPTGNVSYFTGPKLLHYKMAGRQALKDRYAEYHNRRSKNDIENNYGYQYSFNEQEIDRRFNAVLEKAKRVW